MTSALARIPESCVSVIGPNGYSQGAGNVNNTHQVQNILKSGMHPTALYVCMTNVTINSTVTETFGAFQMIYEDSNQKEYELQMIGAETEKCVRMNFDPGERVILIFTQHSNSITSLVNITTEMPDKSNHTYQFGHFVLNDKNYKPAFTKFDQNNVFAGFVGYVNEHEKWTQVASIGFIRVKNSCILKHSKDD